MIYDLYSIYKIHLYIYIYIYVYSYLIQSYRKPRLVVRGFIPGYII